MSHNDLKISVVDGPLRELDVDAIVLAYPKGADSADPWGPLDEALAGALTEAVTGPAFRGGVGRTLGVPVRGNTTLHDLVLVGLGSPDELSLEAWRRAVGRGTRAARGRGARRVAVAIPGSGPADAEEMAAAAAEAAMLGAYRYTVFKEPDDDAGELEELLLVTTADAAAAVERAHTMARAVCWARDLINTSPSDKRPPRLAEQAAAMAQSAGLECDVIDEQRAAELGLNALLAVGRGSRAAPRLVLLQHRPEGYEGAPVLLVGKGVTFDTGGVSIKPASRMDEMKADMSGAAAVLATMQAVAELRLPIAVCAAIPMAENMPGADAYRPGDLVRAYSGTTIEVLNTDAEGRLILADALAYAREKFEPGCIVDLATLTGACVVALGTEIAGLMDNDSSLAAELERAGRDSGDIVWRLPMLPPYRKLIESRVADIKNTGGRWGGAITAAKFLEEFVGDTPWAHLDIAGPAYTTKDAPYQPRGGTGFGVRLLLRWLQARVRG